MKNEILNSKRVAILATDGFEKSELFDPKATLEKAGVKVDVVSLKSGEIKSWDKKDWGETIKVDVVLSDANVEDYDGLLLPGGVINPDKLRIEEDAVSFVREFGEAGKPIAAICHGPWTLIDAGLVEGRKMTSYPSIKTDLINAGAEWVDEEVVTDQGLVTSRKPSDIPAFTAKFMSELEEGIHAPRTARTKSTSAASSDRIQ